MRYVGSKRRLAKDVAPILQNAIDNWGGCKGYIEPFVGGANMICNIRCSNRVGYDSHKYLIALLKHIQESIADLPLTYDEEFYNQVRDDKDAYPDWLVGAGWIQHLWCEMVWRLSKRIQKRWNNTKR